MIYDEQENLKYHAECVTDLTVELNFLQAVRDVACDELAMKIAEGRPPWYSSRARDAYDIEIAGIRGRCVSAEDKVFVAGQKLATERKAYENRIDARNRNDCWRTFIKDCVREVLDEGR
jgi:hypothetical protein